MPRKNRQKFLEQSAKNSKWGRTKEEKRVNMNYLMKDIKKNKAKYKGTAYRPEVFEQEMTDEFTD